MKERRAESKYGQARDCADLIGAILTDVIHYLVLLAIVIAIIWSVATTILSMTTKGKIAIRDILLLFIYLELVAMIGIHFRTQRLPVRFLIYVAITGLTRLLIIDVQAEHSATIGLVLTSGAILILALAVLVIRYGSHNFPLDSGLRMGQPEERSRAETD